MTRTPDPTEPHAEPDREQPPGRRSLVLTSVSAAALFLLLRVLAVAEWNWDTAFAITHTVNFDDAIGIVLGTLMANEAATGVLLILLLPASVIFAVWPLDGGRRTASAYLLAATMVAASGALISTAHAWWVLAGASTVAVILILARLFWHHGPVHRIVRFASRRIGAIAVLAALLLAAVVRTPWVPLEHIEIGDERVTGYVMSSEPGFLKILPADDRELLIVADTAVTHREEAAAAH